VRPVREERDAEDAPGVSLVSIMHHAPRLCQELNGADIGG
jgi:hypothetical protein